MDPKCVKKVLGSWILVLTDNKAFRREVSVVKVDLVIVVK